MFFLSSILSFLHWTHLYKTLRRSSKWKSFIEGDFVRNMNLYTKVLANAQNTNIHTEHLMKKIRQEYLTILSSKIAVVI